ncbi:hypothetical protein [Duganella radicis]|uniref:Uncharacterized protein n=1 Tax=Duganella radicis TaxID=551988 RepID=A0A6L6PQ56_9BURK|nr:hypothetical protein [Duganella radicis]MTV40781.1 hypothetical protein [Duganella radicis]
MGPSWSIFQIIEASKLLAMCDLEYYFIQKQGDDRLPSLTPDENTVNRNYSFEPQPNGSAPFMFSDGGSDYARKLGIVPFKELPDILFDGSNLLVRNHIRGALLALDLPGVHIHPAVFVDAYKNWHEDYWFLAFPERLDCWDRKLSDFEDEPLELGGFKLHGVYTYVLDAAVLDSIPLHQRLLFKMEGRWRLTSYAIKILPLSSVAMATAAPCW